MKLIFTLLVLVLLVLGVSGCTQSSPGTAVQKPTAAVTKSPVTVQKTIVTPRPTPITFPTTEQAPTVSDNTILIENFAFNPQLITVKAGATVRWQNTDNSAHRMKFVDGYTTQVLSPGQSCSRRFDNPGVFDYTDMINPGISGSVRVV